MANKTVKIKSKKVGTMNDLRSGLKRSGGSNFLQRIPADGSVTVRFLTEPTEWVSFLEHYDSVRKFYPCTDNCPGCDEGDRPSSRYLANALNIEEDRVVPLVLPKTLAAAAVRKYDRYGTITDRNYEIIRSGSGLDTVYEIDPELPTKIRLDKYDLIDLMDTLEDQLPSDEDDDDEEEEGGAPQKTSRRSTATPPKKRVIRKKR